MNTESEYAVFLESANNENTSPDKLSSIYELNGNNPTIILALAQNANTPIEVLKKIFLEYENGGDAVFSNIIMDLLLLENPCIIPLLSLSGYN